MRFNRRDGEINYEQIAEFLKASVNQVKTQEDVDVLKQLKKVFKKNVPWNLRGYVSAYLLKIATGNARRPFIPRNNVTHNRDFDRDSYRHNDYRNRNEERREYHSESTDENRQPHPRVEIDPAVSSTIFIGVGRNRRVFPRDLLGILINVANIDRERIGDIRVLANYSFVQLYAEDADNAIKALNGYEYRGRPLSVSYSRQRGEWSSSEGNNSEETYSSNDEAESQYSPSQEDSEDAKAYAAAEKAATNEGFSSPLV